MLLKSFDQVGKYYDILSSKIVSSNEERKSVGWFKMINRSMSALYVENQNIVYYFNKQTWIINPAHKAVTKIIKDHKKSFSLLVGHSIAHKFVYIFDDKLMSVMPFGYIDEEDFDWGLFLSQIINDQERQNRIINQLTTN